MSLRPTRRQTLFAFLAGLLGWHSRPAPAATPRPPKAQPCFGAFRNPDPPGTVTVVYDAQGREVSRRVALCAEPAAPYPQGLPSTAPPLTPEGYSPTSQVTTYCYRSPGFSKG